MSVTPDLKPNEFELTVTCPTGACFAQYTCGYNRLVLEQNASFRKQIKKQMLDDVTKQHTDGRHNTPKEVK